jgi:hypothetical protein
MFGLFKKQPAQPEKLDPAGEYFRACNVYCQPDADQIIVAAVYNHGGLMTAAALRFFGVQRLTSRRGR